MPGCTYKFIALKGITELKLTLQIVEEDPFNEGSRVKRFFFNTVNTFNLLHVLCLWTFDTCLTILWK